ncbi:CAP domain-containing protein [Cupriavidus pinatubonensis]|uniref:CAP domain-containing protein n=1 Tax=Cupriavidus pinatubonensis TaxID=248026 RepID=UPI00112AE806|nr:CAP domain-containing protein [Cupriavidus pinatubonensis]QYY27901.1 CAP domain-containing protein [Cupriavidus pinatubonensis]TPQ41612.1 hypothetical protein C2U69_07185 [Cupriavidus pinatubonensis]
MIRTRFLAALLPVALTACGGGGGGGDNSAQTPMAPPPTARAPQTNVPAPTYVAGSGRLVMFQALNDVRDALGVGLLAQDAALDTAAQAHAEYLQANRIVGHDEASANAGYYADTPLARARKAGAPDTEWIGEVAAAQGAGVDVAADARGCFDQWYSTVYHLQGVIDNAESVGVGFVPARNGWFSTCVLMFGTSTAVPPGPQANSTPYAGGQQMATHAIVTIPRAGEVAVQPGFNAGGEQPNPAPDLSAPGRPLMVYVNGANGEVLTVSSFRLFDGTGAEVPTRALVSEAAKPGSMGSAVADPNGQYLRRNAVFLLPLAPLKSGATYTVSFAGARAGTPLSTSWSFTTVAAPVP